MRFWDTSALVPLLAEQADSKIVQSLLEEDTRMHVWWTAEVECMSAIARLEREGASQERIAEAIDRLSKFSEDWEVVVPETTVRETSMRLLRVHPLRAADALQLAAAAVLARETSRKIEFVSLDERLRTAASREGFRTLPRTLGRVR